jgi:hypothetical protein
MMHFCTETAGFYCIGNKKKCGGLACPAGVEPATYGLEGRCSIQLSYGQILAGSISELIEKMVGVQGFEPWTPCSQSRCATRLRYTPTESLFYTDRAISSKSCNIQHMIAHFSSKFFKSLRVVLTLALLATNLVGTQSIGFAHGVLHANFEKQTEGNPTAIEIDSSYSHGADVCHLFDALSLAGFIPIDSNSDTSIQHISFNPGKIAYTFLEQNLASLFQSRAPPYSLL